MFERVEELIGKDNLDKLANIHILVVGLGGVGSVATLALARSGVSNFILIDGDKIDLSNINRQVIANLNTIGEYKANTLKDMILDINSNARVEAINDYLDDTNILNNKKIDYIVDAVDDIKAKKLLLDFANRNNIKIIISCGAANKLDPSKITITKLSKTTYDPIARIMRRYVRSNKLKDPVVVSSIEEAKKTNKGSIVTVTASFGLYIASFVINDVIYFYKVQ